MEFLVFLYLVNLLRTILIIAIIYYGIRLIAKYVLPLLVAKGVKNMQQKMENQYRQQNQKSSRPEGEVIIERENTNRRGTDHDKGEYVDFEEVE